MNPIGSVTALNGIETLTGALYIEFRISDIQASVIDIALYFLAFDMSNRPSIVVDAKPYTRSILQVVTFEPSDHPVRHVRRVTSVVVIVVLVTVFVVIVIRG